MFKVTDRVFWYRSEDKDDTSAIYEVLAVLAKDLYVLCGVGDSLNNAFVQNDFDHHLRPFNETPYKIMIQVNADTPATEAMAFPTKRQAISMARTIAKSYYKVYINYSSVLENESYFVEAVK